MKIATRKDGSLSNALKAAASASAVSLSTAFRTAGRLIVTICMAFFVVVMTLGDVMGAVCSFGSWSRLTSVRLPFQTTYAHEA